MNSVDRIIRKFGSQTKLAKALGVAQSSVSDWRRSGVIPARRQREILRVARSTGVDIAPADFFDEADGAPDTEAAA